jgi:predicted ATP-grasp superfamily ATP-dependent carboligase
MSYSGLALARSLARRGVKVYGVAGSPSEVGMTSRFVTPVIYPDIIRSDEDTVGALLDLSEKIGEPAVLFPTGDALVLPISRHRDRLSSRYKFLVPEPELAERLVSKDGLAEILQERDLPGPTSSTIREPSQLDHVVGKLRYPVIMKPIYSASWYLQDMVDRIGYRKVIVISDEAELRHWYKLVAEVDPRVILQEFIPGEDANLYYVCGYFNADGKLEGIFAGQKLRITPVHFGSASFVRSIRDDALLTKAVNLLQPLGYRGLFGVEFKKDTRDGEYKIIEVNVRWGLWDGLARRCGIDLGYLAYAREVELPFETNDHYRAGVCWLSFRRDLEAFLGYRRENLLSTWEWIRSLMGETEHAVFAWDDPGPAVQELKGIFLEKFASIRSRIVGTKRSSGNT